MLSAKFNNGTNICITAVSLVWTFLEIEFLDLLMILIIFWFPIWFALREVVSFSCKLLWSSSHMIPFDIFYEIQITGWSFNRLLCLKSPMFCLLTLANLLLIPFFCCFVLSHIRPHFVLNGCFQYHHFFFATQPENIDTQDVPMAFPLIACRTSPKLPIPQSKGHSNLTSWGLC